MRFLWFLTLAVASVAIVCADESASAVVAKAAGDAVIVWQATNDVTALLRSPANDDAILKKLENESLTIMRSKLSAISPSAHSLAVNVIYARTAGVSPVYHSVTFSGFEHLLSVTASKDALKNVKSWDAALKIGTLPAGVTASVTGKLPPR